MRKLFPAIIILLILMQANVLSQPIGFDEKECGIISNPNYHFENYHNPGHGGGYRLYHNGSLIYQEQDEISGIFGSELRACPEFCVNTDCV